MRKRRLPPRPAEPPEGYMYWHGQLCSIAEVESFAKEVMGSHDYQPRSVRDRENGIVRRFRLSKEVPPDYPPPRNESSAAAAKRRLAAQSTLSPRTQPPYKRRVRWPK